MSARTSAPSASVSPTPATSSARLTCSGDSPPAGTPATTRPGWRRRCSRSPTSIPSAPSPTASPRSAISPRCRRVDGRPGVIGFCLGGTLAFGVAAADDPAVCVSYYGSGVPGMVDRLDDVTCPTLFHFGVDGRLHPGRRCGGARRGDRRPVGLRAQRRGRGPRLRQPRVGDVLRRGRRQGRLGQDDGLPRRAPPRSADPSVCCRRSVSCGAPRRRHSVAANTRMGERQSNRPGLVGRA